MIIISQDFISAYDLEVKMYKHWFTNVSNTVSTEIQYEDDSELDNTLATSHLLASEMDAMVAEIQRQLSVNAASLSGKINKSNYGQAVSYVMYVTTAIMGVRQFFLETAQIDVVEWNHFTHVLKTYLRYVTQSGIAPGDIIYVFGAQLENGSYQGRRLRSSFVTLDTSCRRRFEKLVQRVNLQHSFKGELTFKTHRTNIFWHLI